ncbi:MAG: hypothetical protein ABMA02_08645, partial [Saprospiraceae bacterium]
CAMGRRALDLRLQDSSASRTVTAGRGFFSQSDGRDISKESVLIGYVVDVLSDAKKKGEQNRLAKEVVHASLFAGRPFNLNTFRNLLVSSLALVHEYIHTERLRSGVRPVGTQISIVQFFTEKGEIELANKYLQRLERTRSAKNSKDLTDFFLDLETEDYKSNLMAAQTEFKSDLNLLESLNSLEIYFWARRLDLYLSLFNVMGSAPIKSAEEIKAIIESSESALKKPWLDIPLFRLHLLAMRMLQSPGKTAEKFFSQFMAMLNKHKESFSEYHLARLEKTAFNFCSKNFNTPKYRDILFELHKTQLIREGAEVPVVAITFLSNFKLGILGGQADLVRSYIERNRHQILGPQDSEHYYQFALACYYFSVGEIGLSREIVVTLPNFHDNGYKYFSKLLEIKIFYEGGSADSKLFHARLHGLRMTLDREKALSQEKWNGYDNFVKYALKLDRLRLAENLSEARTTKLLEDVETETELNERFWLKAKILELGKSTTAE